METSKQIFGFGFDPEESGHHFLVITPKAQDGKVVIYERFEWDKERQEQNLDQKIDHRFDRAKVALSKHKWDMIKDTLREEFNVMLKQNNYKPGVWRIGQIPVQRLLGKEMVILAWAIEDCDPSVIPNAIRNWNGLRQEERWWLYTMTNASTGNIDDKRGWRIALRYALTDNPVAERDYKTSLFNFVSDKMEEYKA